MRRVEVIWQNALNLLWKKRICIMTLVEYHQISSVPVCTYRDERPDCLSLCSSGSRLCKTAALFAHFHKDIRFQSMCKTLENCFLYCPFINPFQAPSSYLALTEVLPCFFCFKSCVPHLFLLPSFSPYDAEGCLVASWPVTWFAMFPARKPMYS